MNATQRLTKRQARLIRIALAASRMAAYSAAAAAHRSRSTREGNASQSAVRARQQSDARRFGVNAIQRTIIKSESARNYSHDSATAKADNQRNAERDNRDYRNAIIRKGFAARLENGRIIGLSASNTIIDSPAPYGHPSRNGQSLVAAALGNHPNAADILAVLNQDIDDNELHSEELSTDPETLNALAEQYQIQEESHALPGREKGAPRADGSCPSNAHWYKTAIYNVSAMAAWSNKHKYTPDNMPVNQFNQLAVTGYRFCPWKYQRHVELCIKREARRGIEWCFSKDHANRVVSRQTAIKQLAASGNAQLLADERAEKKNKIAAQIKARIEKRKGTRNKRFEMMLAKANKQ